MKMRYPLISITFLLLAGLFFQYASGATIKIKGTCNDSTIKSITLALPAQFRGEVIPQVLATSKRLQDNSFELEVGIDSPFMASLMVTGETWKVFITPGDSVTFNITRRDGKLQILFNGANAPHYNYYSLLTTAADPKKNRPRFGKDKDVLLYKASVDKWYQQKTNFLDLYKKNHPVSADFITTAANQILYEYIYFLYAPLSDHAIRYADLPAGYFGGTDTLDLDHDDLLILFEYRLALTTKYITGFTDDPLKSFDTIYNNIRRTFDGRVEDFLIANTLGFFSQKNVQEYSGSISQAFNAALSQVKDTACLAYIKKHRKEYNALGQAFPKHVLANTYVETMNGARLSLQELLQQYAGKAVYIDFWASWCTACREDIANSREAKQFLNDKNVMYLYFSLDKAPQKKKWRNAAIQDSITENQYLVQDDFSSPLATFLKINAIPRYLILNPTHVIKHLNAPRPTVYQLEQLKGSIIDAMIQVKRYN